MINLGDLRMIIDKRAGVDLVVYVGIGNVWRVPSVSTRRSFAWLPRCATSAMSTPVEC